METQIYIVKMVEAQNLEKLYGQNLQETWNVLLTGANRGEEGFGSFQKAEKL